jgi:hypothetical protein
MFRNITTVLLIIGLFVMVYLYGTESQPKKINQEEIEDKAVRLDPKDDNYIDKQFEPMFKNPSQWDANHRIPDLEDM